MDIISANKIARAAKASILNSRCNQIDIKKQENNLSISDRIPMYFLASLVKSIQAVCPSIDRHAINNEYRRRRNKYIYFPDQVTNNQLATSASGTAVADVSTEVAKSKGGRPVGTTDAKKKQLLLAVLASKNEIALRYDYERKQAGKKYLKRGHIDEIITDVKNNKVRIEDPLVVYIIISSTLIYTQKFNNRILDLVVTCIKRTLARK